jgi:hypothetical protein
MRKVSAFAALAALALAGTAHAQEMEEAPPEVDVPMAGEPAAPAAAPAAPVAAAVPAVAHKVIVGADGALQRPIGTLGEATGPGLGVLLRVEYNLIPNLNGTLRAGYVYSSPYEFDPGYEGVGENVSKHNLPIWVGGKYFVTDRIYGAAEAGLNIITTEVELHIFPYSNTHTSTAKKFGGTGGAGVVVGPVDIKAQLEILDFGHVSDSMAIMVNVGFNVLRS